jgi:hypothetical protein
MNKKRQEANGRRATSRKRRSLYYLLNGSRYLYGRIGSMHGTQLRLLHASQVEKKKLIIIADVCVAERAREEKRIEEGMVLTVRA